MPPCPQGGCLQAYFMLLKGVHPGNSGVKGLNDINIHRKVPDKPPNNDG